MQSAIEQWQKSKSQQRWDGLSDQQLVLIIQTFGKAITPQDVTLEYLRGMDNYKRLYCEKRLPRQVLSFLVRLDITVGINVCSCARC